MSYLAEIVKIHLTYKGGVVSVLKITRENLLSKPSDIFYGERSLLVIVKNNLFIFLVLNLRAKLL